MKKLIMLLLCCFALAGCGSNGDDMKGSNETDANSESKEQQMYFDIDKEKLESEGYECVAGIAYVRIEDNGGKPIVYLVCDKKQPEQNIYLWSQIMFSMEREVCYSITWNNKEYFIDLASEDIKTEEDMMAVLPPDWKEIFQKMQTDGKGAAGIVSKSDADTIDEAVEKFTENYSESDNEKENQKSNKETIDKFEYKYDENNTVNVYLQKDKDTNDLSIFSLCKYESGNTGLMQADFVYIVTPPFKKSIDIQYLSSVGEETYIYSTTDGRVTLNTVTDVEMQNFSEVRLKRKSKFGRTDTG